MICGHCDAWWPFCTQAHWVHFPVSCMVNVIDGYLFVLKPIWWIANVIQMDIFTFKPIWCMAQCAVRHDVLCALTQQNSQDFLYNIIFLFRCGFRGLWGPGSPSDLGFWGPQIDFFGPYFVPPSPFCLALLGRKNFPIITFFQLMQTENRSLSLWSWLRIFRLVGVHLSLSCF